MKCIFRLLLDLVGSDMQTLKEKIYKRAAENMDTDITL